MTGEAQSHVTFLPVDLLKSKTLDLDITNTKLPKVKKREICCIVSQQCITFIFSYTKIRILRGEIQLCSVRH